MAEGITSLLDSFLCGWARYRRWRGGHWEMWSCNLPIGFVWLRQPRCVKVDRSVRPGCGLYYWCEDYPA